MPNWCTNVLLIQGDAEEVQQILDSVEDEGTAFSLDKVITMPTALRGESAPERDENVKSTNLKLYGAKDWYDWSNLNWGTKWNVDAKIVEDTGHGVLLNKSRTVRIQFDSAWAPPLPVYEVLAARFPNTNIFVSWDEPGANFAGYIMFTKGKAVKERSFDSPSGLMNYIDPNDIQDIFDWFPNENEYEEVESYVEASKVQRRAIQESFEKLNNALKG